jgi:hypothetical protein
MTPDLGDFLFGLVIAGIAGVVAWVIRTARTPPRVREPRSGEDSTLFWLRDDVPHSPETIYAWLPTGETVYPQWLDANRFGFRGLPAGIPIYWLGRVGWLVPE